MNPGDKPKFPVPPYLPDLQGITHRQWLVGKAMQGLLASGIPAHFDESVSQCYKIADAILAYEGREKT